MTLLDVHRLQAFTAAEISPDGSKVAVVRSVPRELLAGDEEDGPAWSELHLVDVARGELTPFVTGEVDVEDVAWLPDGSAVSFLATRGDDEHDCLYAIAATGGEAQRVACLETGVSAYSWAPDGERVAVIAQDPDSEEREELAEKGFDQVVVEEGLRPHAVWILDRKGGERRRLDVDGSAFQLRWSPAGDALAIAVAPRPLVDERYMLQRVRIVDPDSGEVRTRIANPGKLDSFHFSPDGAWLALQSGADLHDPSAGSLLVADAETGRLRNVTEGFEGDVADIAWRDADTVVALMDVGVATRLYAADMPAGALTLVLDPEADGVLTSLSLASDGTRAVALAESARHPREVFTGRLEDGGSFTRRTVANPWLDDVELARQEVVHYRARDGLELDGILIHPLEREGARAPLVLIVHGGPEAHYRNGWMTRYSRPGQVLAARGFAVFYPNYRGSTGRGSSFARMGQGDPAGTEFDDLIDAVDHLVESRLADPDRVGVTGGSYGGYATAWLATRHSDRFAAGVMFVGISNKISKVGTTDIPEEEFLVHARKRVWDDFHWFLERSPIYWVEKARTPLLIAHGEDDPRVNVGQSRELYRALATLDQAPVRLVLYPGEKHGNRDAAARFDYSIRLVRWLEHYLQGPGGEPPPHTVDYRSPQWGFPEE